jgi:HK97 family phage prohead protease
MTTIQRNRRSTGVRAKYDKRTGLVHLNVPLTVKADTIDTTARTFEGLAATWEEDLGQDVIHKGAFKESIAEWKTSDEAMPLLNSHDHFDIFSTLGQATALKETDEGLWSKWEVLDGPDGDKVLQRIRPSATTGRPLIGKMSIGFVPLKFDFEQPEGTESFWDRIRHISKASLKEVSLVLFPMNPGAAIDASTVKMWLKMAHDADPKKLDPFTRMELRRLNSRIGLLLKKQKPEDDEELDDLEQEQHLPSTRKTSKPTTARKIEDDSDDDADDLDDELDDSDEEEEDEEEEAPKSEKKPVPDTKKKKPTEQQKKEKKDDDTPAPYIFGEALSQRLQSVTLKHRVADITSKK